MSCPVLCKQSDELQASGFDKSDNENEFKFLKISLHIIYNIRGVAELKKVLA